MSVTFLDLLYERLSLPIAELRPVRFINFLQLAMQVRRERMQLSRLSTDQLAEMGIDSGEAAMEVKRGLFDLPKARMEDL